MEKCLACNSTNCLKIINNILQMYKCELCNAIFLEKEYDQEKNDNDKTYSKIKKMYVNQTGKPIEEKIANYYVEYLKRKTKMNFKSVLDIGAGYGHLLKKLKKLDIDVEGIESSQLKNKLAVVDNIKVAYFDENFELDGKYDLICFTQVLNYLRNTKQILNNIKKNLNDDGLVFIVTTNPESKYVIEGYTNTKEESYYANMLFSRKNFEELQDIGLKMVDYTPHREDVALDYIKGNKIITFFKYRMNLKKAMVENSNGNITMILLKKIN